jgi:hypothetical protein
VRGRSLLAVIAIVAGGRELAADPAGEASPCTGVTRSGGRFATCFDPGNRLSLTAGSDGFGMALALRHEIRFDDEPDLVWKLAHQIADATHAGYEDRLTGTVYRGRYLRHARDGHVVLPLGRPRKVFLPFDVGGLAEVGRIAWRPGSSLARLGVIKLAPLIDLARTRSFRRRFAIGPVARWDVDVDRERREVARHRVTPFSSGLVELAAESASGRTAALVVVEAGMVWHDELGWQRAAQAEASLERIILAVNDRPIALMLGIGYETATEETIARIGARIVLAQRRDPRVRF